MAKRIHRLLLVTAVTLSVGLAAALVNVPSSVVNSAVAAEPSTLTPAEQAWQGYHNRQWQLVDVRTPAEYEAQHIPEAINVPLQVLSQQLHRLDKNRVVVVYCRSGNRSGQATRFLEARGYRVVDAATWHAMAAARP